MENEKLLRKIAWSFAQKSNVEMDDLLQEAKIAYLEAMESYDPTKSRISTWVWNCVSNRLKDRIKELNVSAMLDVEEVELESPQTFQTDHLGMEAQEIVSILLSKPEAFDIPYWDQKQNISKRFQKDVKKKIMSFLVDQGWSMKKILTGFSDLQVAYSK